VAAPDIHRLILQPLHLTGIEYMVTGAVAAIAYGEPRMTNDVDIVVRLGAGDGAKLVEAYPPSEYYTPPVEVIEEERLRPRHGHFNVIHHETALRGDFYAAGEDPLHAWAMARRQGEMIGGDAIWFAPIEYVIVRKLEYFEQSGSDRHLRDIAGMLKVSGEYLDRAQVERMIAERGLSEFWKRANSIPR
jgi:hypothetical protein